MIKFCPLFILAAIDWRKAQGLTLESDIEAQTMALIEIESELDASHDDSSPCPFPDVEQFNTPEYLA